MLQVGAFKVIPLSDGCFHLDAGQMFGVIPKALWAREFEADDMNRIPLFLNPLLVDTGSQLVLIDPGIGDRYDTKFADIYKVTRENNHLLHFIASAGYRLEDVTHVIYSHLHFDHCGGSTQVDSEGNVRVTFPNAEFFAPSGEWQFLESLNERTKASYRPEWVAPVVASGKFKQVEGESTILPGFSYIRSPGHIPNHASILIQSEGTHLIYWGDLFPFLVHLRPAWIPAVDTHPLTALETKKALLKRAFDEGWHYHYFYHEKKPLYTAEEVKEFLNRSR